MWSPIKASTWMRQTARDLGSDFLDTPYEGTEQGGGMGEPLRASAGALYYAVDMRIGYRTAQEFREYMTAQVGWSSDVIEEAVKELRRPDISGRPKKRQRREALVATVEGALVRGT